MSETSPWRLSAHPDPDIAPEFYADVPVKRLLAWVVDVLIVAVLCVLILPFTAFTGLFFFPGLMLVVGYIYRIATMTGRSATWGMRLMALEFRDSAGRRFDLGTAFLHVTGYTISIAFPLLQLVSIVLMLTTARKQGLTDMIIGSAALNRRAGL